MCYFRQLELEEEKEEAEKDEGWGLLRSLRCILPAFCWDGERPVSDGQRSVPRGKAGNAAAGMEGDTGGGAADSWPQRTAHLWQGAQILHCCRSLPPPPPQRTSEAKKQSFRRSYSEARTKEYHLGWAITRKNPNSHGSDPSLWRHSTVQTQRTVAQTVKWLTGINYMEIKVDLCRYHTKQQESKSKSIYYQI